MLAYGLAVPVIAVVYWRAYGPTNFLWLSDIGLALTLVALLTGNRLLASMAAVGVLALELAWTIDFVFGGRLIGIAAYMFDSKLPLYLRGLSFFHLALPPTLLFLLSRFRLRPTCADLSDAADLGRSHRHLLGNRSGEEHQLGLWPRR
jgi:hypothetical protein